MKKNRLIAGLLVVLLLAIGFFVGRISSPASTSANAAQKTLEERVTTLEHKVARIEVRQDAQERANNRRDPK